MPQEATSSKEIDRTIAQCARRCWQAFDNELDNLRTKTQDSQEARVAVLDFRSHFEGFRVWAKNLGVFALDTASTDYRLRDAKDVKTSICNLLDALASNISMLSQLADASSPVSLAIRPDTGSGSSSSEDDDSSDGGRTSDVIEDIGDLVEKLVKISMSIRRSGLKARYLTADAWEARGEQEAKDKVLFEESLMMILEKKYGMQEPLLSRILKAICRQKNRIRYSRTHQAKLETNLEPEFIPQAHYSSPKSLIMELPKTPESFPDQERRVPSQVTHMTRQTEATKFSRFAFEQKSTVSNIPASTVSASHHAHKAGIPGPPQISLGLKMVQCPYCCILIPVEKASSTKKWRKHIISDLAPFVCVDDSCKAPIMQFENENEWFEHHKNFHSKEWWCDGLGHEPEVFNDADAFKIHIRTTHMTEYSDQQLQTLVRMSETTSENPFELCPFCDTTALEPEVSSHLAKKNTQQWRSHIANHLIDLFVTYALPERDDIEEQESEKATDAATRSTARQLDDIMLSPLLFLERSDLVVKNDKHLESRSDYSHQWDFVPPVEVPEIDLILLSFANSMALSEAPAPEVPSSELEEALEMRLNASRHFSDSEYVRAKSLRHSGTGLWLFQSQTFFLWTKSVQLPRVLWVHGFIGSGKTVLSSAVIERLLEDMQAEPDKVMVAYHFFISSGVEKSSLIAALRALIIQVSNLQERGIDYAELMKLSYDGLLYQFLSLSGSHRRTYIILDGLDECSEKETLLRLLDDLRPFHHLRLMITSRKRREAYEQSEKFHPDHYHEIDLANPAVKHDIQSYVTSHIIETFATKSLSFQNRISSMIKDKSKGLFFLAHNQLDSVRISRHGSENFIAQSTTSVDQFISLVLDRELGYVQQATHLGDALMVFQWLCYSHRELRIGELQDIIAFYMANRDSFLPGKVILSIGNVFDVCGSLLDLDFVKDANGRLVKVIRFSHHMIKDYLMSSRCQHWSYFWDSAVIPMMTTVCVKYLLSFAGKILTNDIVGDHPFCVYAAEFWWQYAREVEMNDQIRALIIGLLKHRELLRMWVQLYDIDNPSEGVNLSRLDEDIAPPIYYASSTGLRDVIPGLLALGENINEVRGYYGSALQAAAFHGDEDVVIMLLENGALPNLPGGYFGNPLQAASWRGFEVIVEALLKWGSVVNSEGGDHHNALKAAISGGHVKIVQMLLDHGAEANQEGGKDGSALQMACIRRSVELVETLLKYGADVNARGGSHSSCLKATISRGHKEIVQILLDHGADVNSEGGSYAFALQLACFHGLEEIVELLMEYGADVDAQGGRYGTALQAAACLGHAKIVQLLLDQGADVNAQGGKYGTALQAAQKCNHRHVVKILLSAGADEAVVSV